MAMADDVLALLQRKQHRLNLPAEDISEMLFGQERGYQQRVNNVCVQLVAAGDLVHSGKGGLNDPHTYRINPIARRKL